MASAIPVGTSRRTLSWLFTFLLLCTSSRSHAFVSPKPFAAATTSPPLSLSRCTTSDASRPSKSALNYGAMAADPGPMSQVDSSKSGGCPFLDTSYVYKTYAVPALFSDQGASLVYMHYVVCSCKFFHSTSYSVV